MRVIHFIGETKIEKEITQEEVGFLLSNHKGDYLSLFNRPLSRYQGWFIKAEEKLYRIIENLEIIDAPVVSELRNYLGYIERKRGEVIETFFLPAYYNSLFYETNKPVTVELILDIKESFSNQEFGRSYEIFKEKEIIVEYHQVGEPSLYLVIKSDALDYLKIGDWVQRHYQIDQKRNSPPFERYVYKALQMRSSKIVFSVARNKNQAIQEARAVWDKIDWLKKQREEILRGVIVPAKLKEEEVMAAYSCARNSLNDLVVSDGLQEGLYAGLPWFFQFWTRDEAISLKALSYFDLYLTKKIILRLIRSINDNGRVANISFGKMTFAPPENSDGAGWAFKRIADFISGEKFNEKEIEEIKTKLEKAINGLLQEYSQDGFAVNGSSETWMDSIDRAGARIEGQALRLNMYKLAYQLTQDKQYLKLEKQLRKQVREKFWNGQILADGLDFKKGTADFSIRPNMFLAAYIYPRLLSKKEWIKCFENSLTNLWLKWGGMATIDQRDPLFVPEHTGETPQSYHNGDSWFWINNLAAIVLYRLDKKRFKEYIDKILQASTREILWQGIIGHHGELSSSQKFTSEGSWVQTWSNALYIEAVNEIYRSF